MGDLTMKEAAAMEGGDLNLKMEAVAICGGDRDLKMKVKDAGGSSEGGDALKRRKQPWEEEGGILKLKKEVFMAMDNWFRTQSSPERLARKDAEKKAQALLARKKKMKVVKTRFSKDFIDRMATCPLVVCNDLSDEELAQFPPFFHEVYAAAKIYEAKRREYFHTLVAQQQEMGYAEDEIEVTDDEEEEAAVVKN